MDALRVQWGEDAPEENSDAPRDFAQEHNGSHSVNFGSGESSQRSSIRVTSEDLRTDTGNPILDSATTPGGFPARGDLKPETRVNVNGSMTTLRVAEMLGVVRRNEAGQYVEVKPGQVATAATAAPQQSAERATEVAHSGVALENEARLATLVEDAAPEQVQEVLVNTAIQFAEGSRGFSVEAVASKLGVPTERAAEFMKGALQGLSNQANVELRKLQVDPEHFVEWARANRAREFKAAVVNHVTTRTLAGYKALAREYLTSTAPDEAGLQRAGYEVSRHPSTKELLVKLDGMWVNVRVAARQGRI